LNIRVVTGDITEQKVEAIIVNLFEGVEHPGGATGAVDRGLGGLITHLIASGEIKGKLREVTEVHTMGKIAPERVLVVGLGKQKDFKLDTIRGVAAEATRQLKHIGVRRGATIVHGAGIGGIPPQSAAQALAEGSLLGLYSFRQHMTTPPEDTDPAELLVVEHSPEKKDLLEKGVSYGVVLAEATKLARDWGNEPANVMTPTRMADIAQEIGRTYGLTVSVLDEKQMAELGMAGLLGVSQGSRQEPKFIVMSYRGDDSARETLGLVGKGITFDSGGISIKSDDGMREMKTDMAGGAAVMALMQALAQLKPRVNVTGIVPATENMPDGAALKPGDVIKAMNGKTIEIVSTDAEGRLILADALCYANKLGLSPIIDVATLTGSCRQAFGDVCTGAFTNNQELLARLIQAGEKAGEYLWQMPMYEEYKEQIKGEIADIQNHGGRTAGAITAALFLAEFVEDTPWVHLDIAGTWRSDKDKPYIAKGATGVPLRTLANFIVTRSGG